MKLLKTTFSFCDIELNDVFLDDIHHYLQNECRELYLKKISKSTSSEKLIKYGIWGYIKYIRYVRNFHMTKEISNKHLFYDWNRVISIMFTKKNLMHKIFIFILLSLFQLYTIIRSFFGLFKTLRNFFIV